MSFVVTFSQFQNSITTYTYLVYTGGACTTYLQTSLCACDQQMLKAKDASSVKQDTLASKLLAENQRMFWLEF